MVVTYPYDPLMSFRFPLFIYRRLSPRPSGGPLSRPPAVPALIESFNVKPIGLIAVAFSVGNGPDRGV